MRGNNNVVAGDIADNALFKISEINGQGVLEFKKAPDFETPVGGTAD